MFTFLTFKPLVYNVDIFGLYSFDYECTSCRFFFPKALRDL